MQGLPAEGGGTARNPAVLNIAIIASSESNGAIPSCFLMPWLASPALAMTVGYFLCGGPTRPSKFDENITVAIYALITFPVAMVKRERMR